MRKKSVHSRGRISVAAKAFAQELAGKGYSPCTVKMYSEALGRFAAFTAEKGIVSLRDVTEEDIREYRQRIESRDLSSSTCSILLRVVKLLFGWMEERREILLSPAAGMEPVRTERRIMPVPSEDEVRVLLAQPNTSKPTGVRDRALLETAYGTAARLQEQSRLAVTDLDLSGGTVRLMGKGRRERVVPLGTEASFWLRSYLEHARGRLLAGASFDALWISSKGRPLLYNAMQALFRHHSRAEGISTPISPHALRRACATHMLRNGAHPASIQLLLGHACVRHLSQYLRVTVTDIRRMHERSTPGK